MLTDQQILEVRSHFPLLREKTYLYNCSQGALSDAVEAGLQDFAASWRTSMDPWRDWVSVYEALRTEFAAFIGADADEVAVVTSASAGINPIANAVSFAGRNRVVLGEYEFPTMGHIWLAQQPRGAEIQFLKGKHDALPLSLYQGAIDDRTCIVPLTQVSFVNGFRADVSGITKIAHENGALVFLDGYQDCGSRPINVKTLDVDFFVTGALKYLLGPSGVGFLYVRGSLVERLTPTITSWMAQRDVFAFDTQRLDPAPAARRFESGTPSVPNIFMALAALRFLTAIGMENVATQIERLTHAFVAGVRQLGVSMKTPADTVGPIVVLRSKDAPAVVARMAARNIVLSARHDGVRFAFHVYNTMEDVHLALKALREDLDLMVSA
jgi:selenocysteine lyase/cysteine desulfurase